MLSSKRKLYSGSIWENINFLNLKPIKFNNLNHHFKIIRSLIHLIILIKIKSKILIKLKENMINICSKKISYNNKMMKLFYFNQIIDKRLC